IHYFNHLAVSRFGNHTGQTVRLSLVTTECARAWYARVCVEVDLSKPLISKYQLKICTFYIEYESLENICFDYGFYSHRSYACSATVRLDDVALYTNSTNPPLMHVATEGLTGECMTIQHRLSGKKPEDVKQVPGIR
ncbi:hypothetical protein LINPERPRIM_LOCUS40353, partial [Linum perenne]